MANKTNELGYTAEEVEHIMSIDNMKSMVSKIETLQKPEWIEIYRIIKQNNNAHIQENVNGLWIVLNNLSEDTMLRLHKFVEYSMNNKKQLDYDKNEINLMKMTIKTDNMANDDFIKNSELINGNDCNLVPQTNNGNLDLLYGDTKLTQSETDTLLKNIMADREL